MGIIYTKSSSKRKRAPRRKPLRGSSRNMPDWSQYRTPKLPNTSDVIPGDSSARSDIFVETLEETEEVRAEIEAKSKRVAPLYNKGALQYVNDGDDKHALERKT